jgi:hypothetical protein
MFRRRTILDLFVYITLTAIALGIMTQSPVGAMVYRQLSITFNGPVLPKK